MTNKAQAIFCSSSVKRRETSRSRSAGPVCMLAFRTEYFFYPLKHLLMAVACYVKAVCSLYNVVRMLGIDCCCCHAILVGSRTMVVQKSCITTLINTVCGYDCRGALKQVLKSYDIFRDVCTCCDDVVGQF